MRKLPFAFVTLVILALAACGGGIGGGYGPAPVPTTNASSGHATVSFLIVVPPPTSMRTRPNVVVPSGATSVTFTVDTVNGTAYSGTPTTETLSSSNSACSSVSSQLSCLFNVTAPVGALVYTVSVYNGTSVIAEGNVAVTTTSGTAVNAPLTLSGTVTKIAVSLKGSQVAGVSGTVPVVVDALDANGRVILGTYTNAITVSDTDSTGQTSIATSGSDNPAADQLLSSSDTATLTYAGGAMTTAAVIGASASGVSSTNVTTATFLPNETSPTTNGATTTFGYSGSYTTGYDAPPSGTPSTYSGSYTVNVATGQSFNGLSNLVAITGLESPASGSPLDMCGGCSGYAGYVGLPGTYSIDDNAVAYFQWTSQSGATAFNYVGLNDPTNYQGFIGAPSPSQVTCAAPYSQQLVLPFPASWNVLSGAGPCTYTSTANNGEGDVANQTAVFASGGSYSDAYAVACCAGTAVSYDFSSTSNGSASMSYSSTYDTGYIVSVPAVTSAAATIPVTLQTFPGGIPPAGTPGTPAPVATTVPNPWVAAGLSSGPPIPLESDTFVSQGTIASLPAQCAVGTGIIPAQPTLSEADETIVDADPLGDWNGIYFTETIKHYYLDGVGEICNESIVSYAYEAGGSMLDWYDGVDQNYDTEAFTQWTYVTSTNLTALAAKRGFSKALTATAQAFQAASYLIVHSPLHRPARQQHRTTVNYFAQYKR